MLQFSLVNAKMINEVIRIHRPVHQVMKKHLERCLPEEGCGLLCGKGNDVNRVIALENIKHSVSEFFCDPIALIDAFEVMERSKLELIGIFHSHPDGLEWPSRQDIEKDRTSGNSFLKRDGRCKKKKDFLYQIWQPLYYCLHYIYNTGSTGGK